MIDVFTTAPHYVDHILPIWRALPDRLRGVWYANVAGYRRAVEVGVAPVRTTRPQPADRLTIVASHMDEQRLTRPIIFVEHGSGQHYDGVDASSLGTRRGTSRVVAYLAPNQQTAERMADQFPAADIAVVGCPKLDQWIDNGTSLIAERLDDNDGDPVVAFGWHWDGVRPESKSAWRHYQRTLPKLPYEVLGHAHPRIWNPLASWYRKHGIEPVERFDDVLDRAHVYASDNSSTMFEAAALGLPVVVLNAPWYRRDVDHGLRFWQWAHIGPQVDRPADLAAAIEHAWTERDWYADFRAAMTAAVYPNLGSATEAAVTAIRRVYDASYDAAMDGG